MESERATPVSGKPIEAIWSDAFITDKATMMCGKMIDRQFTRAWFRCVDGRSYQLTKEELLEYKPDARIHKTFVYNPN